MAQLPPKIPTMTPNWPPAFPHQRIPQLVANLFIPTTTAQSPPQPPPPSSASPCWVDEFLDFSSARRGSHRRSISDSIAYLEAPLLECRNLNSHHSTVATSIMHGNETSFDRLDDEQLMSMFSDDMTVTVPPTLSTSNPSTPSDQNSNNDEIKPCVQDQQHQPKNEPGEVDSSSNSDPQATQNSAGGGGGGSAANGDTFLDPKRVKRILANRQSAQRSRVRKLQYISELERSVTSLQTEVSALSPRVAFLDHQRLILNVDNSALKQRIAALAQDKIFKDAHQDALKKEIERLRQIYHQQNLKKMNNNNNNNNAPPPPPLSSQKQQQQQQQQPPPSSDNMDCTDKEQLLN